MEALISPFHERGEIIAKSAAVGKWFDAHVPSGEIVPFCAECKSYHPGRLAYLLVLEQFLYRETGEEFHIDRAHTLAGYLMKCLNPGPDGIPVFMPGGTDPRNGSTTVIDSGSAVDALAGYLAWSESTGVAVEEEWLPALLDHARRYLAKATVSKTCVNQRLWGATGIASLLSVAPDAGLREALVRAVLMTRDQIWPDGGFPYVDVSPWNPLDGMASFSPFYQGRTLAFWHYCAEKSGCLDEVSNQFLLGTELLRQCHDSRGRKFMALENKKWFFDRPFELESNSYDIYCFRAAYAMTGKEHFRESWRCAEKAYFSAIGTDGLQTRDNTWEMVFCAFVDHADFSWFLRSLTLPKEPRSENCLRPETNKASGPAGVATLENEDIRVTLSVSKPATGLNWGRSVAGGGVVAIRSLADGKEVIAAHDKWRGMPDQDIHLRRVGMATFNPLSTSTIRSIVRDMRQWLGVYRTSWWMRGLMANALHFWRNVVIPIPILCGRVSSPQWCPVAERIEEKRSWIVIAGWCADPAGRSTDMHFERTIELVKSEVRIRTELTGPLDRYDVIVPSPATGKIIINFRVLESDITRQVLETKICMKS